jgi:hypothetical protein
MRALSFDALARLRNHVITGFIFMMPVLIVLAVMRFWSHLLALGGRSSKLLHVHTVMGPSGDAVMGIDSAALNARLKQLGKGIVTFSSAAQEPARVDPPRPSLPSRPEDHGRTFG